MGPGQLEPLLNPKSIAVFGATETRVTAGPAVLANLLAGGFEGAIVPVGAQGATVLDQPCISSIADTGKNIDLAIVATPADETAQVIRQCGGAGIRNAVVLSPGFAAGGSGDRPGQGGLVEAAQRSGVRFLGPNSTGLVRPWLHLNASLLAPTPPPGGLALISQSGALCAAIADRAESSRLGFSALVSLGDSSDIDIADLLAFLANDPKTRAILLYVEGVRHACSFISALRLAARIKPVVVLKAGRHNRSPHAAGTHTGALIGAGPVFDAVLERAGAVRVETIGQLFAAAEILAAGKRARGDGLEIITNSSGAGVLAADRAGDLGLRLPQPSPAAAPVLNGLARAGRTNGNPLELPGDAGASAYRVAIEACIGDPTVHGVLAMYTPQAKGDPNAVAQALIEAVAAHPGKPVLACLMGGASLAAARERLAGAGIPAFPTPEHAVEAFSYLVRHDLHRRMALETPGPLADPARPDIDGARVIIEAALAEGRSMLSDIESKAVLSAFRIPANTTLAADSPARAVIAAETVGFPVAMKVNAPGIVHKSDAGGVRTGVMNAADVLAAYRSIVDAAARARPDAAILGVTVEAMRSREDVRELLVGAGRDPVFGSTIMFGAGGTMAEVLGDNAVSLPPLNAVLAERLIKRTRMARLLDGFRSQPPADRGAVIAVLLRLSDLVCELPEVLEVDINPLLAGPDGAVAVDARISLCRRPANAARYAHLAIWPYPRHLVQVQTLEDGARLTIRPIRPEDAESERAFVHALSAEAKRFRFMQSLNELTPSMLAQFTQIDYSREMALVAVTGEDGDSVQHGVARYVVNPDGTSCEFAIVVSDRRQKQGIGTRLMLALMDAARDHRLAVMEGIVLADNVPMLRLMAGLGFTSRRSKEDAELMLVERRL